jgi:ABC-type branched-subunit amino acid transport system substrate-binding protein
MAHEDAYSDDLSSYRALFERLSATAPEIVLIADYALPGGNQQLEALVEAFRNARLDGALLWLYRIPTVETTGAGDRSADPRLAHQAVPPLFEGAFTYDQWDARSPNPIARAFVDRFVQRNDYLPDSISAGVFVACQIAQQAVQGTGSCDNAQLRAYLLDNAFDTIMGTYRFQPNGAPVARQLLLQAIDGALQVVHPDEERTAEPCWPR